MNFRRKLLVPCLMLFLLSIPVSGSAKSIWLEPSSSSEFRLEGIKPEFKDSELSTLSMVWFLSGYLEASDKLHLNVEIPYARFAGANGGESSKSIGNPYLGLDVGSLDSGSMIEFGFRLPMSSDEEIATLLGAYTDYVDRFEAFFPDVLSVIAASYWSRSVPVVCATMAAVLPAMPTSIVDAPVSVTWHKPTRYNSTSPVTVKMV